MTAYTETIAGQINAVSRNFDGANRLESSYNGTLTTTYGYDDNGSLVDDGTRRYGYDQRNMLITSTVYVSGTGYVPLADYIYDGEGNRLQQVDYSGTTTNTITYTNDVLGLVQVLVADDGTNQTRYLFGLDLIYQDDGAETRYLLADGLGSIRTELVSDTVEVVTTYSPYGNLLAQTGASGTIYGFTGEQYDRAADLLFLRARYYSPYLKVFLSIDPWLGDIRYPGSLHQYTYAGQNPVIFIDPSGLLTCEAPRAGCSKWVGEALNTIKNAPLPIGGRLVQALWEKDRTLQGLQFLIAAAAATSNSCSPYQPITASGMPGFTIKFTNDFPFPDLGSSMATRPNSIYIRLRFFDPPDPPSGNALLGFAHELVHVEQGTFMGLSILGEVMAYQVQASLRDHLHKGSTQSQLERDANRIDLDDPGIRYRYESWLELHDDLEWWQGEHSDLYPFPLVPLFPLVNNPFPAPSGPMPPYENLPPATLPPPWLPPPVGTGPS